MTENEWLECPFPNKMLTFLRGKISDRKMRLFLVGCCRRLETDIPDQKSWDAVHTAEAVADALETERDLAQAQKDAEEAGPGYCQAAVFATAQDPWAGAIQVVDTIFCLGWEADEEGDEMIQQASLLRDVVGPLPFRTVSVQDGWSIGPVRQLAHDIYGNRSFDRMPKLADALQEAGCTNQEILDHCRQPGPHVRGCWVVDLILGKQ